MARTKDGMSDCVTTTNFYFAAATEFVASLAIVQLLLRSTDLVLGKVGEILRMLFLGGGGVIPKQNYVFIWECFSISGSLLGFILQFRLGCKK